MRVPRDGRRPRWRNGGRPAPGKSSPRHRLRVALVAGGLALVAATGSAEPLRWAVLVSERDARDAEMVEFDLRLDRHLIETLNTSEVFEGRLTPVTSGIGELLESRSAFASLHYDPTRPVDLPEAERRILHEYLLRGGFLLLVENDYAYPPEVYRRGAVDGSLLDFFARELPRRDPEFRTERLPLSHPIFSAPHAIRYPDMLAREIARSERYAGETGIFQGDRLVGYTYALYGYETPDGFAPLPRPFQPYTLIADGYRVLVNIYSWALSR